jgi:hypothetical protein
MNVTMHTGWSTGGCFSHTNAAGVWNRSLIWDHIPYVTSRHVKWVHQFQSMARPQVAYGGDGLQMWRVAANIFEKIRGQPTRCGPPFRMLGVGLTTHYHKQLFCYEMLYRTLDLDPLYKWRKQRKTEAKFLEKLCGVVQIGLIWLTKRTRLLWTC